MSDGLKHFGIFRYLDGKSNNGLAGAQQDTGRSLLATGLQEISGSWWELPEHSFSESGYP